MANKNRKRRRTYLMDFEKTPHTAHRALGRDGNVSLSYWDCAVNPQDGIPKIIRAQFKKDGQIHSNSIHCTQQLMCNTDRGVTNQLRSWRVAAQAGDCLLDSQHWTHASRYSSVNTIVGGT
eukprot:517295_1